MRHPSVKVRITIWYTLLMILMAALLMVKLNATATKAPMRIIPSIPMLRRIWITRAVCSASSLRNRGVLKRLSQKLYFVRTWVPTSTFSITRILGKSRRFWKVLEIPILTMSWGIMFFRSRPSKDISPLVML